MPLEVCPTSNLRTRTVSALTEHPLPRLVEAGLMVTLNSDDPPMFDTDLTNEYRAAARMGLAPAALVQLGRNAVQASFAQPATKAELVTDIDRVEQRYTPTP